MAACPFVRTALFCVCAATLIGAAACKEEAGVRVNSLKFEGLKAVEQGQLKSVLATGASSKIPWGEKRYFSREQFEADIKRIVAFYRDRGFPDARVASFDVKLSHDQIRRRYPRPHLRRRAGARGAYRARRVRRAARTGRAGFSMPACPLKAGQPADRALLQASREAALDRLKDNGYPYATVRMTETNGSNDRSRIVQLVAEPGILAQYGPIEITGNSSVE